MGCKFYEFAKPTISWREQGGQLPVGRSQQINGGSVITKLPQSVTGNYICIASSASVFNVEAVTALATNDKKKVRYCCGISIVLRTNVVLVAGITILV